MITPSKYEPAWMAPSLHIHPKDNAMHNETRQIKRTSRGSAAENMNRARQAADSLQPVNEVEESLPRAQSFSSVDDDVRAASRLDSRPRLVRRRSAWDSDFPHNPTAAESLPPHHNHRATFNSPSRHPHFKTLSPTVLAAANATAAAVAVASPSDSTTASTQRSASVVDPRGSNNNTGVMIGFSTVFSPALASSASSGATGVQSTLPDMSSAAHALGSLLTISDALIRKPDRGEGSHYDMSKVLDAGAEMATALLRASLTLRGGGGQDSTASPRSQQYSADRVSGKGSARRDRSVSPLRRPSGQRGGGLAAVYDSSSSEEGGGGFVRPRRTTVAQALQEARERTSGGGAAVGLVGAGGGGIINMSCGAVSGRKIGGGGGGVSTSVGADGFVLPLSWNQLAAASQVATDGSSEDDREREDNNPTGGATTAGRRAAKLVYDSSSSSDTERERDRTPRAARSSVRQQHDRDWVESQLRSAIGGVSNVAGGTGAAGGRRCSTSPTPPPLHPDRDCDRDAACMSSAEAGAVQRVVSAAAAAAAAAAAGVRPLHHQLERARQSLQRLQVSVSGGGAGSGSGVANMWRAAAVTAADPEEEGSEPDDIVVPVRNTRGMQRDSAFSLHRGNGKGGIAKEYERRQHGGLPEDVPDADVSQLLAALLGTAGGPRRDQGGSRTTLSRSSVAAVSATYSLPSQQHRPSARQLHAGAGGQPSPDSSDSDDPSYIVRQRLAPGKRMRLLRALQELHRRHPELLASQRHGRRLSRLLRALCDGDSDEAAQLLRWVSLGGNGDGDEGATVVAAVSALSGDKPPRQQRSQQYGAAAVGRSPYRGAAVASLTAAVLQGTPSGSTCSGGLEPHGSMGASGYGSSANVGGSVSGASGSGVPQVSRRGGGGAYLLGSQASGDGEPRQEAPARHSSPDPSRSAWRDAQGPTGLPSAAAAIAHSSLTPGPATGSGPPPRRRVVTPGTTTTHRDASLHGPATVQRSLATRNIMAPSARPTSPSPSTHMGSATATIHSARPCSTNRTAAGRGTGSTRTHAIRPHRALSDAEVVERLERGDDPPQHLTAWLSSPAMADPMSPTKATATATRNTRHDAGSVNPGHTAQGSSGPETELRGVAVGGTSSRKQSTAAAVIVSSMRPRSPGPGEHQQHHVARPTPAPSLPTGPSTTYAGSVPAAASPPRSSSSTYAGAHTTARHTVRSSSPSIGAPRGLARPSSQGPEPARPHPTGGSPAAARRPSWPGQSVTAQGASALRPPSSPEHLIQRARSPSPPPAPDAPGPARVVEAPHAVSPGPAASAAAALKAPAGSSSRPTSPGGPRMVAWSHAGNSRPRCSATDNYEAGPAPAPVRTTTALAEKRQPAVAAAVRPMKTHGSRHSSTTANPPPGSLAQAPHAITPTTTATGGPAATRGRSSPALRTAAAASPAPQRRADPDVWQHSATAVAVQDLRAALAASAAAGSPARHGTFQQSHSNIAATALSSSFSSSSSSPSPPSPQAVTRTQHPAVVDLSASAPLRSSYRISLAAAAEELRSALSATRSASQTGALPPNGGPFAGLPASPAPASTSTGHRHRHCQLDNDPQPGARAAARPGAAAPALASTTAAGGRSASIDPSETRRRTGDAPGGDGAATIQTCNASMCYTGPSRRASAPGHSGGEVEGLSAAAGAAAAIAATAAACSTRVADGHYSSSAPGCVRPAAKHVDDPHPEGPLPHEEALSYSEEGLPQELGEAGPTGHPGPHHTDNAAIATRHRLSHAGTDASTPFLSVTNSPLPHKPPGDLANQWSSAPVAVHDAVSWPPGSFGPSPAILAVALSQRSNREYSPSPQPQLATRIRDLLEEVSANDIAPTITAAISTDADAHVVSATMTRDFPPDCLLPEPAPFTPTHHNMPHRQPQKPAEGSLEPSLGGAVSTGGGGFSIGGGLNNKNNSISGVFNNSNNSIHGGFNNNSTSSGVSIGGGGGDDVTPAVLPNALLESSLDVDEDAPSDVTRDRAAGALQAAGTGGVFDNSMSGASGGDDHGHGGGGGFTDWVWRGSASNPEEGGEHRDDRYNGRSGGFGEEIRGQREGYEECEQGYGRRGDREEEVPPGGGGAAGEGDGGDGGEDGNGPWRGGGCEEGGDEEEEEGEEDQEEEEAFPGVAENPPWGGSAATQPATASGEAPRAQQLPPQQHYPPPSTRPLETVLSDVSLASPSVGDSSRPLDHSASGEYTGDDRQGGGRLSGSTDGAGRSSGDGRHSGSSGRTAWCGSSVAGRKGSSGSGRDSGTATSCHSVAVAQNGLQHRDSIINGFVSNGSINNGSTNNGFFNNSRGGRSRALEDTNSLPEGGIRAPANHPPWRESAAVSGSSSATATARTSSAIMVTTSDSQGSGAPVQLQNDTQWTAGDRPTWRSSTIHRATTPEEAHGSSHPSIQTLPSSTTSRHLNSTPPSSSATSRQGPRTVHTHHPPPERPAPTPPPATPPSSIAAATISTHPGAVPRSAEREAVMAARCELLERQLVAVYGEMDDLVARTKGVKGVVSGGAEDLRKQLLDMQARSRQLESENEQLRAAVSHSRSTYDSAAVLAAKMAELQAKVDLLTLDKQELQVQLDLTRMSPVPPPFAGGSGSGSGSGLRAGAPGNDAGSWDQDASKVGSGASLGSAADERWRQQQELIEDLAAQVAQLRQEAKGALQDRQQQPTPMGSTPPHGPTIGGQGPATKTFAPPSTFRTPRTVPRLQPPPHQHQQHQQQPKATASTTFHAVVTAISPASDSRDGGTASWASSSPTTRGLKKGRAASPGPCGAPVRGGGGGGGGGGMCVSGGSSNGPGSGGKGDGDALMLARIAQLQRQVRILTAEKESLRVVQGGAVRVAPQAQMIGLKNQLETLGRELDAERRVRSHLHDLQVRVETSLPSPQPHHVPQQRPRAQQTSQQQQSSQSPAQYATLASRPNGSWGPPQPANPPRAGPVQQQQLHQPQQLAHRHHQHHQHHQQWISEHMSCPIPRAAPVAADVYGSGPPRLSVVEVSDFRVSVEQVGSGPVVWFEGAGGGAVKGPTAIAGGQRRGQQSFR